MKRTIFFIALFIALIGVDAQEVSKIVEFKDGRTSGSYAEAKFKKAPKKIFINQFNINYQLIYVDSEQTSEGVYKGATSSSISVGFEGVEETDFQGITDGLYNNYISQLKAGGFTVLSAEEASGIKEFAEYTKQNGGGISKAQYPGYGTSTPNGYSYFVKKISETGKEKATFMDKRLKIAKQLGAVVVNINMKIPFMYDSESGASKLATGIVGGVSKVVASPYLRIDLDETKASYVNIDCTLNLPMKDDIQISGVFKDEKFKSIAGAKLNSSYSMGYATMVVSEDVDVSNIQVAQGDPAKYIEGVKNAASLYMNKSTQVFLDKAAGKKN